LASLFYGATQQAGQHQSRANTARRTNGAGTIEIALPNGARVCVDASVNEKALSRVLRAMRSTL
jgi:hypothetical protein